MQASKKILDYNIFKYGNREMKQKSFLKKYLSVRPILRTIMIIMLFILSCKVVKLEDKTTERDFDIYFDNMGFDADKIVNEIWDSKLIPYMMEKASDVADVVNAISKDQEAAGKQYAAKIKKEGEAWNFIVKGERKIRKLDTTSRVGKLIIDVPSVKNAEIIIQIGPVIKGTSIRDSLDFISFDQFINQLEFADLSNSLNKWVVEKVLNNLQLDQNIIGKTLKFYGTFTLFDDPSVIEITPVQIEIK